MISAESNFESLKFNPFPGNSILLDDLNDPDAHFFNNSNIDTPYFSPNEASRFLERPSENNYFSALNKNTRRLSKKFEKLQISSPFNKI